MTNNSSQPLVSVLIFNYNYGKYLKECIESVLNQTYQNIEIIISDNDSSDDSWDIIQNYIKQYPDKFTITKNRVNFGVVDNVRNCTLHVKGKYYILLCADDILVKSYIEKAVHILDKYDQAGFLLVHRSIINSDNNIIKEAPFYNRSCIIPGEEQAAVFMLAIVNPTLSQVMYRTKNGFNEFSHTLIGRWYSAQLFDFKLCIISSMAYINEPLLLQRIHGKNDSLKAAKNLLEVLGPYTLHHQFADFAKYHNMTKVIERLPASIEKMSKLSLRYCIMALGQDDEVLAKQYYHLSIALDPDILSDKLLKKIQQYLSTSDKKKKKDILDSFYQTDNLVYRTISYNAPIGSIKI
jgi:glycosyltransferase involved in cell wall biosynthesis